MQRRDPRRATVRVASLMATAGTLALAGCGSAAEAGSSGSPGTIGVVTSVYPLQYVAERVGGDRVEVANLTRPGGEPHDLELRPRDVAAVVDADLVVYLAGFQPAVDQAVQSEAKGRGLDVSAAARLDLATPDGEDDIAADVAPGGGHGDGGHADDGHADDGHADDAHTGDAPAAGDGQADDGHADGPGPDGGHEAGEDEHGTRDPHFWLDPTRLADVADAVAARLRTVDPAGADAYTARAAALRADLTALDGELRAGLARCSRRELVTSHEAFGYLAERYGLQQVGVAGLDPEAEPDPRTMARIADFVREHGVRTIYTETLAAPDVADTVARATGARTAVLDPLEGLTDASAARDYPGVMRANLAALVAGQDCGGTR